LKKCKRERLRMSLSWPILITVVELWRWPTIWVR